MPRPGVWILGIALGAFMVFGAACGGDDSSKSTPTDKTSASATSAGGAATASGDAKGTSTSATIAAGSGLADLQKATKDLKAIDYRVTYDTTITDAKGAATTGSMTMAHKGTKSLIVLDGSFGGSGGKTTIIDDGTSTFICTEQGQKTCLKSKSTGGSAANPFLGLADSFRAENLVNSFSKDGYDVKSVSGQTIAGRSTKCYEAKGPTGSGTVCLDSKNGMLLLIDGSNTVNGQTAKTVFKAKEATESPSDADFNPPYPVQSLPGQ